MYALKSQPSTAPRTSSAIPQMALWSSARCVSLLSLDAKRSTPFFVHVCALDAVFRLDSLTVSTSFKGGSNLSDGIC